MFHPAPEAMVYHSASLSPHAPFLPNVSVIVPIYNGESDLPDLLEGLRTQTYPPELVEYLLVDNGSQDNTSTILQAAAATARDQGWQIRPLVEPQIQSSYAARNTGIRAATGEVLAFTDADCRPSPNWLYELIQPFQDDTVGLVVGEVLALPASNFLERHAAQQNVLSQKNTLNHPFYPYGQTANIAVKRAVFEDIGLFRPYLTTGGDADFCWRMQQESSWKLTFVEQATVQHRHRSTWRELSSQWQRYGRSNRYLHELHGVPLMRDTTPREVAYLLTRWLVKELPITLKKTLTGQATYNDVFATPINVFCRRARGLGQRTAKLPEAAQMIVTLAQPRPCDSVQDV